MAESHAHDHDDHAPSGGWFATFAFSLGLFLAVWLTVLYIGHTLATSISD